MVMTGRYKQPLLQLVADDRPGLEVVIRGISIGSVMRLAELADDFQAGKLTPEGAGELFGAFADRLVSWNIDDDDDKPVPTDLDGVRSLDADLLLQLLELWFQRVSRAPKASPTPSANGATPPLVSLPMETLPMSPVS